MPEPTLHYEMDEAITLATEKDLDSAIWQLRWHFTQAKMRGENIVCEIWSPQVLPRGVAS